MSANIFLTSPSSNGTHKRHAPTAGGKERADPYPQSSLRQDITSSPQRASSLVESLHLLNLVIASHVDARAVVDVLRHDLQHASHLTVDGLAASCSWGGRPVSSLSTFFEEGKGKSKGVKKKPGGIRFR